MWLFIQQRVYRRNCCFAHGEGSAGAAAGGISARRSLGAVQHWPLGGAAAALGREAGREPTSEFPGRRAVAPWRQGVSRWRRGAGAASAAAILGDVTGRAWRAVARAAGSRPGSALAPLPLPLRVAAGGVPAAGTRIPPPPPSPLRFDPRWRRWAAAAAPRGPRSSTGTRSPSRRRPCWAPAMPGAAAATRPSRRR